MAYLGQTWSQTAIDNVMQANGLGIAAVGMTVVFVALSLITGFIAILPHLLNALSGIFPEPPVVAVQTAAGGSAADDAPLLAAIAVALQHDLEQRPGAARGV
jgi:Na+-transporting methylmalonyl-CoA/oxaloacetate decarboxylase gamma subunit